MQKSAFFDAKEDAQTQGSSKATVGPKQLEGDTVSSHREEERQGEGEGEGECAHMIWPENEREGQSLAALRP